MKGIVSKREIPFAKPGKKTLGRRLLSRRTGPNSRRREIVKAKLTLMKSVLRDGYLQMSRIVKL